MNTRRVLSVGQCGADHGSISRVFERSFSAQVVPADSTAEAREHLRRGRFDLVLVNRILDADGSSGLDVIRDLLAEPALRQVPVMLVSNYEDAQAQAVAAGAHPGFGKSSLGRADMLERVRPILESSTDRDAAGPHTPGTGS
jgi:CheY-like chemotaxis protein